MSTHSNGIYVEIPIEASMDALWQHTQDPALHQRWDLRFSTIDYLPRENADAPQKFLYATRIGFGLAISGEGESRGVRHGEAGEATSSLKFWSDQPLSLIQEGSGYWQYVPGPEAIQFLTWYDYRPRFGQVGRLFDRFCFRPLIGWATAWSFDALRLWLEKGILPETSKQRLLIHLIIQIGLALIWIYQGLVPKLLVPDSGELAILQAAGLFNGYEPLILALVGLGEIAFGLLFLLPRLDRWTHLLNIVGLFVLGSGALFSQPAIFVAPFNPVTLTLGMVALSAIGLINGQSMPRASHCKRRREPL